MYPGSPSSLLILKLSSEIHLLGVTAATENLKSDGIFLWHPDRDLHIISTRLMRQTIRLRQSISTQNLQKQYRDLKKVTSEIRGTFFIKIF